MNLTRAGWLQDAQ